MSHFIDISGQRFGKLVAIEHVSVDDSRKKAWKCLCDCGGVAYVAAHKLRSGKAKACSCGNPVRATHLMSKSRAFRIWSSMHDRCGNPKSKDFKKYGAVGISVDQAWSSFEQFLVDMGEPPKGTSIDRIDGTCGYAPGNCRWATITEQNRNRRNVRVISADGFTGTILDWSSRVGIPASTIHKRIQSGMSPEEAVPMPLCKSNSRRKDANAEVE